MTDPMAWGITVQQLVDLKGRLIQEVGAEEVSSWSFYDLNNKWLKRHLESHPGLGYASTLNQHQPKRPNRMISHWWGENFCEFVNTMQLEFGPSEVLWVCTFAIHQSSDPTKVAAQVGTGTSPAESPFAKVINQTKQTSIFVSSGNVRGDTFTEGNVWNRIWCVYEIFHSQLQSAHIDFIFSTDTLSTFRDPSIRQQDRNPFQIRRGLIAGLTSEVNIANAQASVQKDKDDIIATITRSSYGVDGVNELAKVVRFEGVVKSLEKFRSLKSQNNDLMTVFLTLEDVYKKLQSTNLTHKTVTDFVKSRPPLRLT